MVNVFSKIYAFFNHSFKTKEERALIKVANTDETKLDKEFGAFLAKSNINLALRFWIWAMYTIIAVRFFYGIDSIAKLKQNLISPERVYYDLLYGFLFVITVLLHVFCIGFKNRSKKHYRLICFSVDTYFLLFVMISFFVTFVDPQNDMVGYALFLSIVISCYALYIRPLSSVFTTVTVTIGAISAFVLDEYQSVIDFNSMIRIILIMCIACATSIFRYISKYVSYINERNISHQRDELRKLNLELEKSKEQLQYRNKQLQYVSSTDLLTGLSNRRKFVLSSNAIIQELSEKNEPLTVAVIDVDNFKMINDTNGHLIGDACLMQIGKEFLKIENENISCYRFGGDEFIILLKAMSKNDTCEVVDNLVKEISNIELVGYEEVITLSIGVYTEIPKTYQKIDYFIEQADKMLYGAKKGGKNRVEY